jgi:rhamnopyranosyl-N-acetylglucosaminyl-diphospho-decaprenol beta-1,3/1,4-galactofuranosyltransferase
MQPSLPHPRVVAVVVAYNRQELVGECLAALLNQSRPVDAVVIVDNASTDRTLAVVRAAAPDADVVALTRNTGGAGGFTVGIARAMEQHSPDWVWVMDDDTVPNRTALDELLAADAALLPLRPSVLASRVVWIDGQDHPMNTPRPNPFATRRLRRHVESSGGMPVRSSSFVSSMFSAEAIRKAGFPVADYFLWNDDFEFASRLIRRSAGVVWPTSVVVHKTRVLGSTDADPGERFYWEVRNKVWLFRFSRSLSLLEKALYLASSLARWVRTFRGSANRPVLRAGLVRGLRDGFGRRPHPNSAVLADAGVPGSVLAALAAVDPPR